MIRQLIDEFVGKLNLQFGKDDVEYQVTYGVKYARVIRSSGGSKSAWGFIALSNGKTKGVAHLEGDLLYPASWERPAKHSRGNIVDGTGRYHKYGVQSLTNI